MPVSTGSLGEPRVKRCKLCDESSHRSESGSGYWQLQLDRDLVDTISAIYPEWFKHNMAEGGGSPSTPRESPPKAVIDTSPILMDQNKESLKVKLLLRRPFDQLVAQGIMPPHKTPAAYHGQRRQLERAKTGDMLKAKIQQRPPRQELERRHILEADPNHVDPSLAERQRMLKKARLADQLNDQLSHRPGPLELIQKNILHTEEPIEQAVKTGRIPYKATSEGQLNRPQHPQSYITPEEDSQSSEGDNLVSSPGPSDVLETAAKSAGIVVSLIQPPDGTIVPVDINSSEIVFANLCGTVLQSAASPVSLLSTSTLSPLSSIASPVPSILSQPATPAPVPVPPPLPPIRAIQSDAPGKDKNHRKKSKSKSAPKTRTIKFHEYKGPPSAHKVNNALSPNSGESSYDLLLKQQTLLLQFQLQLQHKYPQIILPAGQKQNATETCNNINTQQASPAPSTSSESSTQIRITGRLEDMKVNDLKAELKRRSLPVSGSKPQLIERLKPFTNSDQINLVDSSSIHSDHSQDIGSPNGSVKDDHSERMELDPMSPNVESKTNEELVREQQRQIEELQRELTLSHMKLQAVAATNKPKHELLVLQKHIQAKQQQNLAAQMRQLQEQQAREQVNEEQKRIQQQQHVAFQNQKNLPGGLLFNGADAALLFSQLLQQGKAKLINGNNSGNFIIATPEIKVEEAKPPPPLYEEATKQIKKSNVKSQIVQDVLEILIENGELPPSAANDPATPNSAGVKPVEPVYPKPIEVSFDNDNLPQVLDSLDSLDNMDINELVGELAASHNPQDNVNNNAELMMDADDTDAWFESLITSNSVYNNSAPQEVDYDPVFGLHQDPFDPDPFNLEEFRSPADLNTSWDKFDYAA